MKSPRLPAGAVYTFSDYFNLNVEVADLLAHFDYAFGVRTLNLPEADVDPALMRDLRTRLEEGLPYVSLTSEVARREFLIAPVLWEVVRYTHARLRVEVPLEVNEQLRGTLDYYLEGKKDLLVVEAKQADPLRGFTQLAVELVALDQWTESETDVLYGAVSLGEIWRFGILERWHKRVVQDVDLYPVPTDLERLMRILVAILM